MSVENIIDFKSRLHLKNSEEVSTILVEEGVNPVFADLFGKAMYSHYKLLERVDYGFDVKLFDQRKETESSTDLVLLEEETPMVFISNTPLTNGIWQIFQDRTRKPSDISTGELANVEYVQIASRIVKLAGGDGEGGKLIASICFGCGMLSNLIQVSHELYSVETTDGSLVYFAMYVIPPDTNVQVMIISFTAAAFKRNLELNPSNVLEKVISLDTSAGPGLMSENLGLKVDDYLKDSSSDDSK